jgi:hypothetical protein
VLGDTNGQGEVPRRSEQPAGAAGGTESGDNCTGGTHTRTGSDIYVPAAAGCLALISNGESNEESVFAKRLRNRRRRLLPIHLTPIHRGSRRVAVDVGRPSLHRYPPMPASPHNPTSRLQHRSVLQSLPNPPANDLPATSQRDPERTRQPDTEYLWRYEEADSCGATGPGAIQSPQYLQEQVQKEPHKTYNTETAQHRNTGLGKPRVRVRERQESRQRAKEIIGGPAGGKRSNHPKQLR